MQQTSKVETMKKAIKRACALGLPLLLMGQSVWADTIEVENTGTGFTLQEAIDEAVRRSIEQVKGVELSSERTTSTSYETSDSNDSFNEKSRTGERSTTAGKATYRIISERCKDKECRVRLIASVEVPDGYERQEMLKKLNKNRRTIAIAPFTGTKGAALTREVESRFVQDRKFSVLTDRNSTNLDYVLMGNVIEAYTRKATVDNSKTVELTGEYIEDVSTTYASKVLVEYKLIDRVNGQVKWSATVPTVSGRNNLSLLVTISADKIFKQLKENIYPLVLMALDNGNYALNSGGSTVQVGERLNVYSMGQKIIDPVTKESLGYDETKVAQVKVTRVLPKLAYVSVVSGTLEEVEKMAIARKVPVTYATAKPKPKTSKPVEKSEPKEPTRVSF